MQTAPLTANILPSVTRKFVLKAAENAGLAIQEKSMTPEQAAKANELFTAVTTQDIVPVVRFDGISIGDGVPGPHTKKLIEEFRLFRG
jgi:branched-subunit amino acid aminotransferase/4-amino-4-deoxychorismate lyase